MLGPSTIATTQLARLIGTPDSPPILDMRTDEDFARDPRNIPGAQRRDHRHVADWAAGSVGEDAVVVRQRGAMLSEGVAAWLRHAGARAETLEGGFEAWASGGGLLIRPDHVPPRDATGRTLWVTRVRRQRLWDQTGDLSTAGDFWFIVTPGRVKMSQKSSIPPVAPQF